MSFFDDSIYEEELDKKDLNNNHWADDYIVMGNGYAVINKVKKKYSTVEKPNVTDFEDLKKVIYKDSLLTKVFKSIKNLFFR